jgi:uncharacterized protein
VDKKTDDPQEIPWISDLIPHPEAQPRQERLLRAGLARSSMLSSSNPNVCLHMLGQMIQVAGADHILWGTDSIWNGSPQSQIERLRRLKMPEELMEKYGYPELTDEMKNQILGLNAAKLFGIDVKAKRQAIKADKQSSALNVNG